MQVYPSRTPGKFDFFLKEKRGKICWKIRYKNGYQSTSEKITPLPRKRSKNKDSYSNRKME
jgi:hypothetical protein